MEQQQEAITGTGPGTSSKNSVVCPICLEPIKQEAYLDRCLHTFCYRCIANWTDFLSQAHQFRWQCYAIEPVQQEEDVDIIMHHILGVIDTFFKRQEQDRHKLPPKEKQREFKQLVFDAARPFICDRTDRFVDEFELFLASSLNIEAYDKVYMECAHMLASAPCKDCTEDEHDSALEDPRLHFLDEDLSKGC
ncbi:hypothetical protein Taro_006169 [Colocasia esculenta]|uniref:RING-type domain-containing protein n=1 Tax=Colocasia esculenta TaxID=4460 RepID=A0A843TWV5_COLES|nr:hypothetical protein [Colocasia esculenta]